MLKQIVKVNKEVDCISYSDVNISDYQEVSGEKALSHSFAMDILRKIMGKTLTIIDASIADKQQNKAMKDLIRNAISEEMEFCAELAFDQKALQSLIPENVSESKSVTVEEALGVE